MEKSSTGLNANVAGLLCYVLGWITGLVFWFLEKSSKFVRFHALQSIIVFGALTALSFVLGFIPVIGAILGWFLNILSFVLWIILMLKAFKGEMYRLPWAGAYAEKKVGG